MNNPFWWLHVATHLWRAYFSIIHSPSDLSPANLRKYDICNAAYARLTLSDRSIVRAIYDSPCRDVNQNIERYSTQSGIPSEFIYTVRNKANRIVMEELGIVDREIPVQKRGEIYEQE